jgi:hypothetical protein
MFRMAMRVLLPGLLPFALVACARETPGPEISLGRTGPDSLCIATGNSYECAQLIERHQLSKPQIAQLVTRSAGALRLRLLDGGTLVMEDREEADLQQGTEPDTPRRFSLRDYLEGPAYYVLHRQLHEGADYLLVHAGSGAQFTVPERPVISPDGLRVVTASAGLSGMSSGNAVQVWRLDAAGIVLEYELSPGDWEPSEPGWLDDSTIQLRQQAPLMGDGRAFSRSIRLVRRQGEWRLDESPAS